MNGKFKILYKDILKDKVKFEEGPDCILFTDDSYKGRELNTNYGFGTYDLIQNYLVKKWIKK